MIIVSSSRSFPDKYLQSLSKPCFLSRKIFILCFFGKTNNRTKLKKNLLLKKNWRVDNGPRHSIVRTKEDWRHWTLNFRMEIQWVKINESNSKQFRVETRASYKELLKKSTV